MGEWGHRELGPTYILRVPFSRVNSRIRQGAVTTVLMLAQCIYGDADSEHGITDCVFHCHVTNCGQEGPLCGQEGPPCEGRNWGSPREMNALKSDPRSQRASAIFGNWLGKEPPIPRLRARECKAPGWGLGICFGPGVQRTPLQNQVREQTSP